METPARLTPHQAEVWSRAERYLRRHDTLDARSFGCAGALRTLARKGYLVEHEELGPRGGWVRTYTATLDRMTTEQLTAESQRLTALKAWGPRLTAVDAELHRRQPVALAVDSYYPDAPADLPACDTCGRRVRVATGLHAGAYRHDDDTPDALATWCETPTGYVRVRSGRRLRSSARPPCHNVDPDLAYNSTEAVIHACGTCGGDKRLPASTPPEPVYPERRDREARKIGRGQPSELACTGTVYPVNPDAPEEGTDVRHTGPCPRHPHALRHPLEVPGAPVAPGAPS